MRLYATGGWPPIDVDERSVDVLYFIGDELKAEHANDPQYIKGIDQTIEAMLPPEQRRHVQTTTVPRRESLRPSESPRLQPPENTTVLRTENESHKPSKGSDEPHPLPSKIKQRPNAFKSIVMEIDGILRQMNRPDERNSTLHSCLSPSLGRRKTCIRKQLQNIYVTRKPHGNPEALPLSIDATDAKLLLGIQTQLEEHLQLEELPDVKKTLSLLIPKELRKST